MATRRMLLLALVVWTAVTLDAQADSVRSDNFIVEAPNKALAEEFARLAEKYRREKAIEWLGREMPRWAQPCPLRVTPTMSNAKGATTFTFPNGQVTQTMFVEGPLDRLKYSVLPHEVTHTVLAHHFRQPVPRWADEGGSVYSEDEMERSRHDKMCREILNDGRGMPLRRLFSLTQYPNDVMVLYAQGYSVTKFLVESSDRQTFLNFVGHGMQSGWDEAVSKYYQYRDVKELEQAWLDHLRKGRASAVVRNPPPPSDTRLTVRQNVPPAQPLLDPIPITRGLSPTSRERDTTFGTRNNKPAQLGDPGPIQTPNVIETTNQPRIVPVSNPRTSPPPVVLFPPEPLPLR